MKAVPTVVNTHNTTINAKSGKPPPLHPVNTESQQHSPTPTPSKPVCQCCARTAEKCDSIPYKLLANKPVYSEMSNALPPVKTQGTAKAQDMKLRIMEKNYDLKCDSCR
ncbi:uncharacterized protein LOC116288731 [Actinia tenebrosa]|uniref:Uncharacterized protein LOC116288731 n=1 Tax=Actinia tenebrosa TaxID=6105 RepID=A0A6P8HFR1_ACTTE|nr:uncharacterized protein LOC116288731 [Actinia tenebrosa]